MPIPPSEALVIFPGANGEASVLVPAITDDLTIEAIIAKDVPAGRPHRIIARGELPTMEFFDAWIFCDDEEESAVRVDMAKAREVHRNRIRAARGSLLADLDVQFVRALEDGTPTAEIVAMKQALRDAPLDPAIDAAETPAELVMQWNTELLGASPYLG
jgi:hypothetical protein